MTNDIRGIQVDLNNKDWFGNLGEDNQYNKMRTDLEKAILATDANTVYLQSFVENID